MSKLKLKRSLAAFAGVLALVSAVALLTPQTGRAQKGGSPTPLNVNVVNTEAAPVPVLHVSNLATQSFQRVLTSTNDEFAVPAGKLLVIEHVSGYASNATASTCTFVDVRVRTTTQGQTASHYFVPTPTATTGGVPVFAFSQEARLYADSGTAVGLNYGKDGGTPCSPFLTVTISGHLVDVPATPAQ